MHKKRNLIILLSIIGFILICILVIFAIYLKTDLLKSNKQLFFKYMIEKNEMWDMISLNQKEIKDNRSYVQTGTVDFIYEYNGIQEIENDNISTKLKQDLKKIKNIENLSGDIIANVDKNNKKMTYKIELLKDESDIMDIEFVRDNDKYAFKSKEILKSYLGIENNNLNEFSKKMSVIDSENFPDKINIEDILKNFFELSNEDREHIYETYKNIIIQSLDEKKYGKENNKTIIINNNKYNTNLYTLTLTKKESIELLINILQTLKKDSITLNLIRNKIKIINPESKYTNIKNIIEQIDTYLQDVEKIEKTDNEFIRIDVYANKNSTKKVDLIIENEKKLSLEYDDKDGTKNLEISQNNLLKRPIEINYNIKDAILSTKKIKITKNNNITAYQFVFYNIKDIYSEMIYNVENRNIKNEKENLENLKEIYDIYKEKEDKEVEISLNIELYAENDNKTKNKVYLLVCNSKIGVEINSKKMYTENIKDFINLDNSNSIMINNYSKETIEKLLNTIKDKIINFLDKKI